MTIELCRRYRKVVLTHNIFTPILVGHVNPATWNEVAVHFQVDVMDSVEPSGVPGHLANETVAQALVGEVWTEHVWRRKSRMEATPLADQFRGAGGSSGDPCAGDKGKGSDDPSAW